jgi:nucleoside-diphosphate-sugar epimerase
MRILVTGATGYVGSRLVTVLLANGHQVPAASRYPERLDRFGWFGDTRAITPPIAQPTLGLVNNVPGPLAGALRTGLDVLVALTAKVRPA